MILDKLLNLINLFVKVLNKHYLSVQLILTSFSLVAVWLFQYLNIHGNAFLITRMYHPGVNDRPWMPDNSFPTTIFGYHYFGDWLIRFSYLNLENPYDRNLALPEVFPPSGLLFFKILAPLGAGASFLLFTLTSVIIWQVVVYKFLPSKSILEKNLFLFLFVFVTLPFLFNLDRGSVFSFIYGLLCVVFYLEKTNQKKALKIALMVLIISLKPYLVLILLWWLRMRNYKVFSQILVYTCFSNLASIFILKMPFQAVYDYFYTAKTFNKGMLKFDFLDQLNGLAWVSRIYAQFNEHSDVGNFVKDIIQFNNVLNALILLTLTKIVLDRRTPDKIAICYLVAGSPMLITSMQYTMCSMSLIVLFLASDIFVADTKTKALKAVPSPNSHVISEFLIWIMAILMLTPFFLNVQDIVGGYSEVLDSGPGAQRASHLLNTYFYAPLFLLVSIAVMFESRKKDSQTEHLGIGTVSIKSKPIEMDGV